MSSFSAFSYSCVLGAVGHCIWGFDKKDPGNLHLIDQKSFLEFCDKNNIYCSALNNGYNTIMGRYLNDEVFLIADKGWGGPDLILENKDQARQFTDNFKGISKNQEALFFVKNDAHPMRHTVGIGYKEKTSAGIEEIKLMLLPNEWESSGDDYSYVPPDE
jgi:hypothetical protein